MSLACKPIVNLGITLNPTFRLESLLIENPQLPSPSVNPVINQGLIGAKIDVCVSGLRAFIFIFIIFII
jgi:hypothetical protein